MTKRRLLNVVTRASLILAIALAALWPLSYWRAAFWSGYSYRRTGSGGGAFIDREWTIGTTRGQIIWQYTSYGIASGAGWAGHWQGIASPMGVFIVGSSDDDFGFAGFYWHHQHPARGAAEDRLLKIPHWFLLVVFVVMPARRWLQRRAAAARLPGMCALCGYDLRASPERCPECGRVVEKSRSGSARIRTENQGIMSPLL